MVDIRNVLPTLPSDTRPKKDAPGWAQAYGVLAFRTDPKRLCTPIRMGSNPMIVQAKGQPAAIVPTTTQTPKAIIPAEIRSESTISMIGPPRAIRITT